MSEPPTFALLFVCFTSCRGCSCELIRFSSRLSLFLFTFACESVRLLSHQSRSFYFFFYSCVGRTHRPPRNAELLSGDKRSCESALLSLQFYYFFYYYYLLLSLFPLPSNARISMQARPGKRTGCNPFLQLVLLLLFF
jgi:hypothetical protein